RYGLGSAMVIVRGFDPAMAISTVCQTPWIDAGFDWLMAVALSATSAAPNTSAQRVFTSASIVEEMTPADFKRLALGFDGAEEGSHMGAVDFRVGGRIFASLAAVKK